VISLLPFVIFWFLTFRETSDRMRSDSEALLAQTAKDWPIRWTGGSTPFRRAAYGHQAARHPFHEPRPAGSDPQAISREYPWMYLVFTVAPNGMNVARSDGQPLVSYADRQYIQDIVPAKPSAGRP